MSYTKLNVEIEKYLKANNLPWVGKSTDTKEETERRRITPVCTDL
jgi:tRNA(Ile)-lysidine synthase TilS/MesJ